MRRRAAAMHSCFAPTGPTGTTASDASVIGRPSPRRPGRQSLSRGNQNRRSRTAFARQPTLALSRGVSACPPSSSASRSFLATTGSTSPKRSCAASVITALHGIANVRVPAESEHPQDHPNSIRRLRSTRSRGSCERSWRARASAVSGPNYPRPRPRSRPPCEITAEVVWAAASPTDDIDRRLRMAAVRVVAAAGSTWRTRPTFIQVFRGKPKDFGNLTRAALRLPRGDPPSQSVAQLLEDTGRRSPARIGNVLRAIGPCTSQSDGLAEDAAALRGSRTTNPASCRLRGGETRSRTWSWREGRGKRRSLRSCLRIVLRRRARFIGVRPSANRPQPPRAATTSVFLLHPSTRVRARASASRFLRRHRRRPSPAAATPTPPPCVARRLASSAKAGKSSIPSACSPLRPRPADEPRDTLPPPLSVSIFLFQPSPPPTASAPHGPAGRAC